jgi:hypothetical protein
MASSHLALVSCSDSLGSPRFRTRRREVDKSIRTASPSSGESNSRTHLFPAGGARSALLSATKTKVAPNAKTDPRCDSEGRPGHFDVQRLKVDDT